MRDAVRNNYENSDKDDENGDNDVDDRNARLRGCTNL